MRVRDFASTSSLLFVLFGVALVACDDGPGTTTGGTGDAGTSATGGGGSAGASGRGGSVGTAGVAGSVGTAGGPGVGGSVGTAGSAGGGGTVGKGGGGGTGGSPGGAGGTSGKGGAAGTGGSPPGQFCGGLGGLTCGKGQFCNLAGNQCGTADAGGLCAPIPNNCPEGCSLEGICGCDGNIYCNECEANAKGVSVAPSGFCAAPPPPPDRLCGGKQGKPCFKGEFCDYSNAKTCGETDESGICRPLPAVCSKQCQDPGICGCDGQRYCSACAAELAGVSPAPNDAYCGKPTPTSCGGFLGQACAADEYCSFPPDAGCGFADGSGTCIKKEINCTKQCDFVPICGCDGQLYCNSCSLSQNGVSQAPDGSYCKK